MSGKNTKSLFLITSAAKHTNYTKGPYVNDQGGEVNFYKKKFRCCVEILKWFKEGIKILHL